MNLYLAVAGMPVNPLIILGLGGIVGMMSGLFGVGGGFLLTPLLMMFGIPPAVAAASDSNQIVAASCSGALAHKRLGNVDIKMGLIFLSGAVAGGTFGTQMVKVLRLLGNYDVTVKLVYVVLLALVGGFMLWESLRASRGLNRHPTKAGAGIKYLMSRLPLQTEFRVSGIRASIVFVVGLGFLVGFLAALLGVGGGFITVPAMIYLLGMPTLVAIGTDLFQIVFTSINVTFQQAVINHSVDVLLAVLLFCGSTIGAQLGARLCRYFRPEQLRVLLAVIVLLVMVKLAMGLVTAPEELITLSGAGGGH
ncbi:sulfite exporter TauE/SafE family protein [Desulforudis sp. 1088]|uniref:sulfite exporter TauE/SafE family protein n=1 Tax=unclassified Candidatus Desulforudis TaxID=2635950 RepID=UPI003CE53177